MHHSELRANRGLKALTNGLQNAIPCNHKVLANYCLTMWNWSKTNSVGLLCGRFNLSGNQGKLRGEEGG